MQDSGSGPGTANEGPAGEDGEDLRNRAMSQAVAVVEAARGGDSESTISITVDVAPGGQVATQLVIVPESCVPLEVGGDSRSMAAQTVNELRRTARKLLIAAQRIETASEAINTKSENAADRHRREVREEVLRQRRQDAKGRPPDSPP